MSIYPSIEFCHVIVTSMSDTGVWYRWIEQNLLIQINIKVAKRPLKLWLLGENDTIGHNIVDGRLIFLILT